MKLNNEKLSLSSSVFIYSLISGASLRQTKAEQRFFEFHWCLFISELKRDVCVLENPFSDVRTGWGSRLCGFRVVILPHQEITIQPTAFPEGQQYITGYQRQNGAKLVEIFFLIGLSNFAMWPEKQNKDKYITTCVVSVEYLIQNTCLSYVLLLFFEEIVILAITYGTGKSAKHPTLFPKNIHFVALEQLVL